LTRLNNYLTERSAGEDMEVGIIQAWNYYYKLNKIDSTAKLDDKWDYPKRYFSMPKGLDPRVSQDACISIANILSVDYDIDFLWEAKRLGGDQQPVSQKWKEYGYGKNSSVPKTDFMIGDRKISLKTGGAAQLMSADRAETIATFYAALELSGLEKSIYTNTIDNIQQFVKGTVFDPEHLGVAELHLRGLGDELLTKAYNVINNVGKSIEKSIKSDPRFARAFAYEAMSGKVKFGDNEGTATHVLSVSWDGETVKYNSCDDVLYLEHIAAQMKPNVSMKTASSGREKRGFQVSLRLTIDKLLKMQEEVEKMGNRLDENFLAALWNKVKGLMSTLYSTIKNALSSGLQYFLEFMGIEPEIRVETVVQL